MEIMKESEKIIKFLEHTGFNATLVDRLTEAFVLDFLSDDYVFALDSLDDIIAGVLKGKISKNENGFISFGVVVVGEEAYNDFRSNVTGAFNAQVSKGPIRYVLQSARALFVHGKGVSFYKPIVGSKEEYEDLMKIKLSNGGGSIYIKCDALEQIFRSRGFDENTLKIEDDGTIQLDYDAILALPIKDIGKIK